jgi:hypothetical protein
VLSLYRFLFDDEMEVYPRSVSVAFDAIGFLVSVIIMHKNTKEDEVKPHSEEARRGFFQWLETSAGTVHKTHYLESFRTRERKNLPIWTGCLGHGLTRWAAAILSQRGMDSDKWPDPPEKTSGALPSPIKF